MDDFGYYIFALVVLVVGFLIVKKVATCLVKTIIGILVLAILAGIYWVYIALISFGVFVSDIAEKRCCSQNVW